MTISITVDSGGAMCSLPETQMTKETLKPIGGAIPTRIPLTLDAHELDAWLADRREHVRRSRDVTGGAYTASYTTEVELDVRVRAPEHVVQAIAAEMAGLIEADLLRWCVPAPNRAHRGRVPTAIVNLDIV